MSPVLFNAASEKLMRYLEEKWQRKRWGVKTYMQHRLVDLRFADDLLLIAGSLHQAQNMLKDLICKAKEFGLEVHEDKTKILWNGWGKGATSNSLDIEGAALKCFPPTSPQCIWEGCLI